MSDTRTTQVSLLCSMFGWGYMDAETAISLLDTASAMGIESDEIREYMTDCDMKVTDVNSWIYVAMDRINSAIFDKITEDESLEESIQIKAGELRDDFSPFINFMDSHFNNVLDEFSIGDLSLEDGFINKVVEMLK